MNYNQFDMAAFKQRSHEIFSRVSTETVGWLAVVVMHAATIPSLLAVMNGLTDVMLPIDIVLLVWTALVLLFVKAAIQRDLLNMITIGLGFFVQAALMALIFFK
jgi:hypothetical protein